MNIILLSGGSGKRLWPLSNETRSKQFFKLFKDSENNWQSMVQRVYGQIIKNGLSESVIIATGKNQVDSIYSQIGKSVEVVTEPERRDTFPAIALSCAHLYYNMNKDSDDSVIVIPVDQYAEEEYYNVLHQIDKALVLNESRLVLMGISPTYPSEKYGYILTKNDGISVSKFIEKPQKDVAIQLIKDGAFWNGGVFGFKLGYMINKISKYFTLNSFEDVLKNYSLLPRRSFDYEITEKETSISLKKYNGEWKDLGTWNTLSEVMDSNAVGKVLVSDNSKNTHVINELDIPIVVLGIKDSIIAASPDGILVTSKEQSSYIKSYVEQLNQRPMYEEKSWGEYKIFNYNQFIDNYHSLTKQLTVKAGGCIQYQSHQYRDEIWIIIDGNGTMTINDIEVNVCRGDVMKINRGSKYSLISETDMLIIEIQFGQELNESDAILHDMI